MFFSKIAWARLYYVYFKHFSLYILDFLSKYSLYLNNYVDNFDKPSIKIYIKEEFAYTQYVEKWHVAKTVLYGFGHLRAKGTSI